MAGPELFVITEFDCNSILLRIIYSFAINWNNSQRIQDWYNFLRRNYVFRITFQFNFKINFLFSRIKRNLNSHSFRNKKLSFIFFSAHQRKKINFWTGKLFAKARVFNTHSFVYRMFGWIPSEKITSGWVHLTYIQLQLFIPEKLLRSTSVKELVM